MIGFIAIISAILIFGAALYFYHPLLRALSRQQEYRRRGYGPGRRRRAKARSAPPEPPTIP